MHDIISRHENLTTFVQNRYLQFMYQKGISKQTDEGICYHYTFRLNLEHTPSLVKMYVLMVFLIVGTISLLRLHMLNKSLSQVILVNSGSLAMTFPPGA